MNSADASSDNGAHDPVGSDQVGNDRVHSDQVHSDQIHQGYDLETGMLVRAHEWIDLFPWLRLVRVLRVAGSPPLLMLTAIVLSLWFAGGQLILGENAIDSEQAVVDAGQATGVLASRLLGSSETSLGRRVAAVIWATVIWSTLGLFLARQGALLTAGRTLISLGPGLSLSARRTPASWLAALIPFVCLLPFALAALLIGWLTSFLPEIWPVQGLLGLIVALIALPSGLLTFGAMFAVPISWAALANERDADSLDSLSRGYEYLYRRPVQLVLYVLIGLLLMSIAGGLAWGVSMTACQLASITLGSVGASPQLTTSTRNVLQLLPPVVVATLFWSLLGGVYLLLRRDAGGQEVEDLWIAPAVDRPALPELPKS